MKVFDSNAQVGYIVAAGCVASEYCGADKDRLVYLQGKKFTDKIECPKGVNKSKHFQELEKAANARRQEYLNSLKDGGIKIAFMRSKCVTKGKMLAGMRSPDTCYEAA